MNTDTALTEDPTTNSTTTTPPPMAVRASDAERERYAAIIGTATGDGRLTTIEADERLATIYAARFRHELDPLIADLGIEPEQPKPAPTGRAAGRPLNWQRGPLATHAAIVVVLGTIVVVRWLAMGGGFFWPIVPLFWFGLSLFVHARIRRSRPNWRRGVRSTAD